MITHFLDWPLDRPASYRTIYPDGQKTQRMKYSYAVSLKIMYGGKVVYDPPQKEE